jgi:hypothetical protein
MGTLAVKFTQHSHGTITLESARDQLRHFLHSLVPQYFTWGEYTNIHHLFEYVLSMPTVTIESHVICKNNHTVEN